MSYLCRIVFILFLDITLKHNMVLAQIWEADTYNTIKYIPSDKNLDVKPLPIPKSGDEYTCTICMCVESPELLVVVDCCSHRFHKKCIFKWGEMAKSCPMCRKGFYGLFSIFPAFYS